MKKERSMTAFYLETLLMVLIFVAVIVIISQVLGLAKEKSREADQLNNAVCLALNAAEAASAADSGEALCDLLDEGGNVAVTGSGKAPELTVWYDGSMQPLTPEQAEAAEDVLRLEVTWMPEDSTTGTFVNSQIQVCSKSESSAPAGIAAASPPGDSSVDWTPVYTLTTGTYRQEVPR